MSMNGFGRNSRFGGHDVSGERGNRDYFDDVANNSGGSKGPAIVFGILMLFGIVLATITGEGDGLLRILGALGHLF